MGLGKFGWGKYGTGQIWVRANMGPGLSKLDLGQIWDRANMAGQIWSGQTWPGKLGLGKYVLTPHMCAVYPVPTGTVIYVQFLAEKEDFHIHIQWQ